MTVVQVNVGVRVAHPVHMMMTDQSIVVLVSVEKTVLKTTT